MKEMDLLNGNIKKLVVRIALPMVVAQRVSMLYNIVDRIFVGRIPEIGAVALDAVFILGMDMGVAGAALKLFLVY